MVIIVAAVLLGVRIDNSDTVKTLRYKTWDYFQQIHPREVLSDSVTVLNITEEDLKTYGQWPWPRHIMAMLHAKLGDAGALIINYNILFAEPDRMSGVEYLKSIPMDNELRNKLGNFVFDTALFDSLSTTEKTLSVSNNTLPNLLRNSLSIGILFKYSTPLILSGSANKIL
jgi:adenylate cyclase